MDYFKLCKWISEAIYSYKKKNKIEPEKIYLKENQWYLLENIDKVENPTFFGVPIEKLKEPQEGFRIFYMGIHFETEAVLIP